MTALQPGVRVGPYVVEEILPEGRGGFAQVVIARHIVGKVLQERVALKFAHASVPRRGTESEKEMAELAESSLLNEVDILRELKQMGIVRLYAIPLDGSRTTDRLRAQEIDGQPWYYAMEYLSGGSVELLIHERGRLEVPMAVEVIEQTCMALAFMHAKGLAHMDIKASNIMLRQPYDGKSLPQVVLVDFGGAQKSRRQAAVDQGVLVYMPPERIRITNGELPPESLTNKAAVDIYSLGIALYRMLTGKVPFSGHEDHVRTAILSQSPTMPSQYNHEIARYPDLDQLIQDMLNKDPQRRPSAVEIIQRLEKLVPPPRIAEGLTADPARLPKPQQNWKVVAFVLLALAVIQFGAVAYFAWPVLAKGFGITGIATPTAKITSAPTQIVATKTPIPKVIKSDTPTKTPTSKSITEDVTSTLMPKKEETPTDQRPTEAPATIDPNLTPTVTPNKQGMVVTTTSPTVISVPSTAVPPTAVPPTAVPPTAVPPTAVPSTAVPPTAMPPTAVPPTAVPPTAVPPTAVPPTAVPPTAVPPTAVPYPYP